MSVGLFSHKKVGESTSSEIHSFYYSGQRGILSHNSWPYHFFDFKNWLDVVLSHLNATFRPQVYPDHPVSPNSRHLAHIRVGRFGPGSLPVFLVQQRHEVANLDLALASSARDNRVDLLMVTHIFCVGRQQSLDRLVAQQNLLREPQNLKGLLAGHEAALNAEPLLSHLLSALVLAKRLKTLFALPFKVGLDPFKALGPSNRTNKLILRLCYVSLRLHSDLRIRG